MGSTTANSRSRFHRLNFWLDPINYFKPEHPKPQQVGGQFPRVGTPAESVTLASPETKRIWWSDHESPELPISENREIAGGRGFAAGPE
jgi:hypothetical protein